MKYLFFILITINFLGCSGSSQKNTGIVTINSELTHPFFDNQSLLAQEGADTIYVDSSLIYFNDSLDFGERFSNADINDLNHKHFSFDTCNGSFSGDTAVILFKTISNPLNNQLLLKIIGDQYFAFYQDSQTNTEYDALPDKLELNKKVEGKDAHLKGYLQIKFIDPQTKSEYVFNGPFFCEFNN